MVLSWTPKCFTVKRRRAFSWRQSGSRIYIVQKRKISVGDKILVVMETRVLFPRTPVEDMPFLPERTSAGHRAEPVGRAVPYEYRAGFEIHLSLAAKARFQHFRRLSLTVQMKKISRIRWRWQMIMSTGDWNDFKKKYKKDTDPEVAQYLEDHLEHRKLWKGVRFHATGKSSFVTDVQARSSMRRLRSATCII